MQLSRKQVIVISVVSGVVLLLTLASALFLSSGEEEGTAEPTAAPEETALPTDTPAPPVTPSPTLFRLPLVPQFDTPSPTGTVDALVPGGLAGRISPTGRIVAGGA